MENEKANLVGLLMKYKAQLKMTDFVFMNNPNAGEKQMNAILDEKLRIEKNIETIEKALKELENRK